MDEVNRPCHYIIGGMECKDVIRDVLNAKDKMSPYTAYCIGNVIKYVYRAGNKGDLLKDLRKARNYLDFAIDEITKDN